MAAEPSAKPSAGTATDAKPLLEVKGLKTQFMTQDGVVKAVDDVSFYVMPGETLGVVGESGSGKTTLMKAIAGLVEYTGTIEIDGTNPRSIHSRAARRKWLARNVGIVFQNAGGSLVPHMSVLDQVTLPMRIHRMGSEAEQRQRARELLDLVKLPDSALMRSAEEMSGGQRQRVAIARSLALNPRLIIADEPTSALDISVRAQLIGLLDALRKERDTALVVISHDLTTIEYLADRVAVMYRGSVVESASADDLAKVRMHPYSRDLWRASPRLDLGQSGVFAMLSEPDRPDTGCRYATRCDRWTGECSERLPDMVPDLSPRVRCLHPLCADADENVVADAALGANL